MKKYLFSSLCLLTSLFGENFMIIRGGYFDFTNTSLQSIYKTGGYDTQLILATELGKGFYLQGNVEFLYRKGQSENIHQKTSTYQIPVSIALQGMFDLNDSVDFYILGGPRYSYLKSDQDSNYVPKHLHFHLLGVMTGGGFYFHMTKKSFLDLFVQYAYEISRFDHSFHSVSNSTSRSNYWVTGIGYGYKF
jgi:hypothetical protein